MQLNWLWGQESNWAWGWGTLLSGALPHRPDLCCSKRQFPEQVFLWGPFTEPLTWWLCPSNLFPQPAEPRTVARCVFYKQGLAELSLTLSVQAPGFQPSNTKKRKMNPSENAQAQHIRSPMPAGGVPWGSGSPGEDHHPRQRVCNRETTQGGTPTSSVGVSSHMQLVIFKLRWKQIKSSVPRDH